MSDIEKVRIKDISKAHIGQVVQVRGWLRNKPGGKGRYFLWLRDGSGEIQAVAEQDNLPEDVWADCERIGIESSIIADGLVRAHPKQEGTYELELRDLKVFHCVNDYPIGKKSHGVEFLMKQRHLWLRGKRQSAILRVRSEVHKAFADFFYDRGFFRVDTPIFTPNACEGTTTLFEVDYHGDTVYLSQSGQLYNEADIGALGQVYCFSPAFRAEKSKTRRHLLEFWMLEMEAAWYDHEDNMRFQEEMMAFTVGRVLERCEDDLKIIWESNRDKKKRSWEEWRGRLETSLETPYPRIRYSETIEIVNKARFDRIPKRFLEGKRKQYPELQSLSDSEFHFQMFSKFMEDGLNWRQSVYLPGRSEEEIEQLEGGRVEGDNYVIEIVPFRWGDDYGAPDEQAISDRFDRPVFITNFPVEIKGFYFKDELNDDGTERIDPVFAALPDTMKAAGTTGHTVQGSDCIGPEGAGELIGSSQREDDFERLMAKVKHHQLPEEYIQWYLDTRRFGNVPHSGFGIGLERTVCWLCGGSDNPVHIREAITFPRMLHQYEP